MTRLATYDDLLALPDGERAEIIGGSLVTLPSTLPRHSRVQRTLANFVGGPFDDDDGRGGPGGWWILLEVDVRFGAHDIVRPDAAGWRRERLANAWDTRPIDVVPDWICEVLSPSNPAHDRVTKRRHYGQHAVPFYWIVDPAAGIVEALEWDRERSLWLERGTFGRDAVVKIPPFEAVELEVGRLFPIE